MATVESRTAAQIEAEILLLETEREITLERLQGLQATLKALKTDIDRKLRTHRSYAVSFRALRQAPVIEMATYVDIRDKVNALVEEIEPQYAKEQRISESAEELSRDVADIDKRLAELRLQAQESSPVLPFRRRKTEAG